MVREIFSFKCQKPQDRRDESHSARIADYRALAIAYSTIMLLKLLRATSRIDLNRNAACGKIVIIVVYDE
jgi:hypothetical protein